MSVCFSKLARSSLLCSEAGCGANGACAARRDPCGERLAGSETKQSCLKQEIKKPKSSICSVFFSPCLLFPLCTWVGLGERMCLEQCDSSCGQKCEG